MWEYNHTDELFHSEIYTGQENGNDLAHHKYISKKKINGKWRYYYDEGEIGYKKERKSYNEYKYENPEYTNARRERFDARMIEALNSDKRLGKTDPARRKELTRKRMEAERKFRKVALKTLPGRMLGNAEAAVRTGMSKALAKKERKNHLFDDDGIQNMNKVQKIMDRNASYDKVTDEINNEKQARKDAAKAGKQAEKFRNKAARYETKHYENQIKNEERAARKRKSDAKKKAIKNKLRKLRDKYRK